MTVFIYALNEPCSGPDPTAGRTRYVGKAVNPYARYEEHLNANKRERCHKANWIRGLLKMGKTPILEILDEVHEAEWQLWECEWIRLYRALGFRLTNQTDGGTGLHNPSPELRKRIGDSRRGKPLSEEHRRKVSTANKLRKGRLVSQETRTRMSKAGRGRAVSVETRNKISTAHKGSVLSEQHRKNLSNALKGRVVSEDTRRKLSAAKKGCVFSEQHRKNLSLARINYYESH